ncbi:FAD/NAD(P)-binding domain-containing protein [Conidiobolus coronatus NRRL 28638]|uniref:FAD/NAD(P)-binding domain-containing protein n=1 Tax=Conidiobolus coronatus (strain ATCC 28846 / CBS 209.66 / NRRL 28638) TaxID=796925 RepID=A0A137NWT6_CONC2|nr:FAD/NAD(P)-binding domain-containing protein [Conidiobolus coronatus NRRL 28638]|eukprot:KXN67300.1 FAD/NAD(P)-binding domain-containing protein [Conidiobolus coronatus NRRL 28638]
MTNFKSYADGSKPKVAILGAGVSGIVAGHQIKKHLGIDDFVIFEGEEEVGGTWQTNTYPGCACDINSHVYSIYDNLNPNWTKNYVGYSEIHNYLKDCVDKFNIRDNIKLNTWVTKARFDNDKKKWNLTYTDMLNGKENQASFDILIGGVGPLRIPNIPEHLTKFDGPWTHSAKWDHSIELKDKVVGIIGSGASAVQIVPNIIDKVSELHTFHRTPPFVFPKGISKYSKFKIFLLNYLPGFLKLYYWIRFFSAEFFILGFTQGSLLEKLLSWVAKIYINRAIKDETKRKLMTPNYALGCKRITPSDTYYNAIDNPKTYVHDGNIKKIEGKTLYLKDGSEVTVDVLILATGYKTLTPYQDLDIVNTNNEHIDLNYDKTEASPQLNYGITMSGVPNFFMMLGPTTALGHNSVIYMIECQANYIVNTLKKMINYNVASIDLKPDVGDTYWQWVQRRIKSMVWHGSCQSWYLNSKGEVVSLWPGSCIEYYLRTINPKLSEYNCTPKPGY